MVEYKQLSENEINKLCLLAKKVKCRYPNYKLGDKNINYDNMKDLSSSYNLLTSDKCQCDCTGVTWLLIINYYFHKKSLKSEVEQCLNQHIISQLPDPQFHLYFPREDRVNDVGTIYYLKYLPFYQMMEYLDLIHLKTNNMGWWCICLGNYHQFNSIINDLTISKTIKENTPIYLCFWDGDETSMAIVTYDQLLTRLLNDAKRDWTDYLNGLEKHIRGSTEGLMNCKLKINNLNMESVEFLKCGSLFQPDDNSNLDLAHLYQNKANNLCPLEKNYIKTNLI